MCILWVGTDVANISPISISISSSSSNFISQLLLEFSYKYAGVCVPAFICWFACLGACQMLFYCHLHRQKKHTQTYVHIHTIRVQVLGTLSKIIWLKQLSIGSLRCTGTHVYVHTCMWPWGSSAGTRLLVCLPHSTLHTPYSTFHTPRKAEHFYLLFHTFLLTRQPEKQTSAFFSFLLLLVLVPSSILKWQSRLLFSRTKHGKMEPTFNYNSGIRIQCVK